MRVLAVLIIWVGLTSSGPSGKEETPMVGFLREYLSIKYPDREFDRFIYVAAKRQRLYIIDGDDIEESYVVSTARKGIGNQSGSYQTPQGLHSVAEKVGGELPINSVIKNKMPTGGKARIVKDTVSTGKDYITSRILHLRGMEESVNSGEGCDSYSRGIFIHGTHEEGLLGTPASKGCVRMSNTDVADLYDRTEVGTFVVILNN